MGWDANTVAVWTLDNTKTDATGHGYTFGDIGTGVTFANDVVYGTYSYSAKGTTNNFGGILNGGTLFTYLNGKSWTIEGWMYLSSTATGLQWYIGCNLSTPPHVYFLVMQFLTNGTGNSYYNDSAGGANWSGVTGWHFISIQYDQSDTYAKYYVDGALVFGIDTAYNFFTSSPTNFYFFADYNNTPNTVTRMNKIIVSDVIRNGVETLATPDGKTMVKIGYNVGGNNRIIIGGTI